MKHKVGIIVHRNKSRIAGIVFGIGPVGCATGWAAAGSASVMLCVAGAAAMEAYDACPARPLAAPRRGGAAPLDAMFTGSIIKAV